MKVTKLTVGRCRRAKPPGEDAYYEVEIEVEGLGELENAKTAVQAIMDGWLNEPEPRSVGLDPKSLDGLPWKSFSKKEELAEKGDAGWLFADAEDAEELVKVLKAAKESCVRLAGFKYLLSGKDGKFVKRLPYNPPLRRLPSRKMAGADEAAQPARSR